MKGGQVNLLENIGEKKNSLRWIDKVILGFLVPYLVSFGIWLVKGIEDLKIAVAELNVKVSALTGQRTYEESQDAVVKRALPKKIPGR